MEIESVYVPKHEKTPDGRNKESLLKMEIESLLLSSSIHSPSLSRNKESLLKMEIERLTTWLQSVSAGVRNKESLLKMEIESLFCLKLYPHQVYRKQRKSPENGDWKTTRATWKTYHKRRNKESLLKMEIESCFSHNVKVNCMMWNKESLLKMEIESYSLLLLWEFW